MSWPHTSVMPEFGGHGWTGGFKLWDGPLPFIFGIIGTPDSPHPPGSIFTSEPKQRRIGATVPGTRTYGDGLDAIRIGGFLHTGKPGAVSRKHRFHVVTETDALGVLVF